MGREGSTAFCFIDSELIFEDHVVCLGSFCSKRRCSVSSSVTVLSVILLSQSTSSPISFLTHTDMLLDRGLRFIYFYITILKQLF